MKSEALINKHSNEGKKNHLRLSDLKMVITGSDCAHKRTDGVFVVSIGCLKN